VIMALMLEDLDVHSGQRVLEIGVGTGYNAALLKGLAGPRGRVISLDIEGSFVRRAKRALQRAAIPVESSLETAEKDGPQERPMTGSS